MLIDTHAHLWWPTLAKATGGERGVIEWARAAGVEKIIVPGTGVESSQRAVEMAKKYMEVVYCAVGIHPEATLSPQFRIQSSELRKLIRDNRKQIVAVGEVGLDFNTAELRAKEAEQGNLLRAQCEMAKEFGLPVIVHTRESVRETLEVLGKGGVERAQFHCFSGTEEELKEVLRRGYYVSFCGNVSWSKRVRKMTAIVPGDRLLLETDSPFMIPRREAGAAVSKVNEPANVTILAQIIARERGEGVERLEKETRENTKRLFGI